MKKLNLIALLLGIACIVAIIAAYLSEQMGLTVISNFFSIGAIATGIGSIVVDSKPFKN
jgi:NhaP-type Na+/H+ and K+/H+ antiporter